MDRAAKLVSPKGLCHAVEGGTNCARLSSRASLRSPSGVAWPPFAQGGGETGQDFDSFLFPQAPEERVFPVSDLVEELEVTLPVAAALGAGSRGNCCVLGSERSNSSTLEVIAAVKRTRRKGCGFG